MAKWGYREHKWESYTNIMLFIGSIMSLAWLHWREDWLVWFVILWMIVTTGVHLIARIFHRLEKHYYKGKWR